MTIPFSPRARFFEAPKQWASMRRADRLQADLARTAIIHLEKGDYSGAEFKVPGHVTESLHRAVLDGMTRYDPGPGLPELREALAATMTKRSRPTVPAEVVITAGAKQALSLIYFTFVSDGDEVILTDPGYPPNQTWAHFLGASVKLVRLDPGSWQIDLSDLQATVNERTRLIVINSPQRPNGAIFNSLEEIVAILKKWPKLIIVSDEIFSNVVYHPYHHQSISQFEEVRDRVIVINTFSKTYAMTGFRIGWLVAPTKISERISFALQDLITNVPVFIQRAALSALQGPQDWVHEKLRVLQERRDLLCGGLAQLPGFSCPKPAGTFYAFPNIEATGLSSLTLANWLLEKCGVAVVEGTAFGPAGEGHLRLTFANTREDIEEGLSRMRTALSSLPLNSKPLA